MSTSDRTADSTFDRVAVDLAHAPFPELAAAIRTRITPVLQRWRDMSLKAMPHLDALTLEQFEDTIADILSAAAAALESGDARQLLGVIESGPQHGIDRFLQEYSLLDLFEEVRILRGVVIVEIAEEMERALQVDEAATFHAIFDIIIQQGVIALTQKQNELLQQTSATTREMNERLLASSVHQHELTEQSRHAEEALRESERRFRALFELGPVAVYSCDATGVIREFNRRAAELWGREPAIGDTDERFCGSFRMIRPDGSVMAHEQCPMAEVLSGVEPHVRDAEVSIERPDGSRITVVVNIRPLKNEQGVITGAINCFYDITERKEMELRVRNSEERFRTLADNMAQLAWTCDVLGNATWYNHRWYDYTGMSFAEMQGFGWRKVQHPDHVERVVQGIERSRETGEPWEDTFPLRSKDGEYRWFLSRAVPIRGEHGSILRWFGTNTDITEQRQLQNKIAQQAEQLARESRHKDEFLATLAHELRNPLAPIRNAVQFLGMEGMEEADANTAREVIVRQVAVMVRLVDDLLDVSRINRNKLDIRRERVELATILESAVESSHPMIDQFGHELTVDLPLQPIELDADPIRLAQVFLNLLNNAAKYTRRRGRIWLAAWRDGNDAVVSVRDNGTGIPADMLARIFEMFTQVDRSLDQSQGGLGIGLTLVRRLVEMHDGSIEAHSQGVDQGSEFLVRLPLRVQPQHEPTPPSGATRAKALSGSRILVVDDNKDSANSLGMLLRQRNNDIRVVYDGQEAVKAADDFRPELVLLDIGLPKLNGYEVARRIRQQPWGQDMILVALTGWGQDEDRRRSQDAGFDFHFVKPVELATLEKLLVG